VPIVIRSLVIALVLACAACSTGEVVEEGEPVLVEGDQEIIALDQAAEEAEATKEEEGEVPLAVAQSPPPATSSPGEPAELVVHAPSRPDLIRDLVSEAKVLLRNVDLPYVFRKKGKKEVLRGRPVAFALWSEKTQEWSIAHVEIPRPPVKWKPGGKPIPFIVSTPGIRAQHVRGTGAERLMFAFSKGDEQMKVYGRKFPVFDSALVAKKKWRAVAQTAKPIVYLPFTEDTLDPFFVDEGREYLLVTARKAIDELRLAKVPSSAFRGELLADVVPPEVLTTLAVIEQTDDADFREKRTDAVNEVLSQYGLKREEAYRYSVSSAAALGPMQITNRKGNGTYALVVRRCPGAKLNPNFERGATDLANAMKAAVCLFDLELAQMRADIRLAYQDNMRVLGIFPVAAYNGGPKNVRKLYDVMKRMHVDLDELQLPAEGQSDPEVACPCLWVASSAGVRPVGIPRYNNENRWYIEKYQSILTVFD
jgi:hypothetical protein